MKRYNRKQLAEQMQDLIQQWKGSGLSMAEFCEKNHMGLKKFSYWRSKLRKSQKITGAGKFVKIVAEKEIEQSKSGIDLFYPNGVRLHLNGVNTLSEIGGLIKLF